MIWAQLTVVGIAEGCILALSGLGIVLTYKATGIFNFAHGAIGVLVAYVLFQFNAEWGIPLLIAAPLAILVVGPGFGLLLERVVFRPLQRAGATTTEKLVATIGVLVMVLGLVFFIWTGTTRVGPNLFSPRSFDLGGIQIAYDHIGWVSLTVVISGALWFLFQRTHLGTEIRAVVDRPELAELASVNANRVAGLAWAMGAGLAGIAGVLFAAGALEPFKMTLFIIQTFSVAVVARLTNLPIAVATGILIGLAQSLLIQVHLFQGNETLATTFEELKPNLPVVVLFVALLIYKRLDIVGEAAERVQRLAAPVRTSPKRTLVIGLAVAAGLVILPWMLDVNSLIRAQRFLAFTVIFVSIVAVTGFSGQITLGQAGFAGIGAWGAARAANSWGLPVVPAMIVGGLVAMIAGVAAGWPALRRRGLFLGLTTLAIGLLIYRVVLQNTALAGGVNGLQVFRPSMFGWDLADGLGGHRGFYYFELAWVGLMLLFARNLRSGRLGRALGAMRDSEDGARSVGIDLRAYKLFIFGASAFIAGIGGTLLTQQALSFSPQSQFFPLESLFWFAVVVVAGVSSILGAVLGAFVWVMLGVLFGAEGLSQLIIGLGALLLGRLPGGSLLGVIRALGDRVQVSGRDALAQAQAHAEAEQTPETPLDLRYEPSEFAIDVIDENGDRSDGATTRRQKTGTAS